MNATYLFFLLGGAVHAGWDPSRSALQQYNAAVLALGEGAVEDSEALFRAVLTSDPGCGRALHGLGMSLLRQNRSLEALAVMERASQAYPQVSEAHVGVSVSAFAVQDFDRAHVAAREAVRLEPASLEAQAALVSVLLRLGRSAEAQDVVAGARGHVDGPSLACLEVQVLAESGRRDEALQRLPYCKQSRYGSLASASEAMLGEGSAARLADVAGADRIAQVGRAVELVNAGEPDQALSILDPLVAAGGPRADVLLVRARARHALGDDVGARADLEASLSGEAWVDVHRSGAMSGILLQSHADALLQARAEGAALLVQLLLEAGELVAAQERLSAARRQLGNTPPLDLADARILRALGALEEAWSLLLQHSGTAAGLDLIAEWAIASPGEAPEAALSVMAASTRWIDRYNLAVVQHNRADYPRCLQAVHAVEAVRVGALQERQVWELGYRCAVFSEDLDAADRLVRQRPSGAGREADRVNHARLRYQAGRPADTLALLRDLSEPSVQALASSLAVRAHGDLGQWAEAVRWSDRAPPQERYWLGSRLAEEGRLQDARRVLSETCGELVHESGARCSQLLLQLGGPI